MPEDFVAPKDDTNSRWEAREARNSISALELSRLVYDLEMGRGNHKRTENTKAPNELEFDHSSAKPASSSEFDKAAKQLSKSEHLIPAVGAQASSIPGRLLNDYREPLGAAAGVLSTGGIAVSIVRMSEKYIPSPTGRILLGAGTALMAGGLINNEVSGREMLDPTGYVHNAGLSAATFALGAGSYKAVSRLEIASTRGTTAGATDMLGRQFSVKNHSELVAATEAIFKSMPKGAEGAQFSRLAPATEALLSKGIPISSPAQLESTVDRLLRGAFPVSAETRAAVSTLTPAAESMAGRALSIHKSVQLTAATESLIGRSIPINVETRNAVAQLSLAGAPELAPASRTIIKAAIPLSVETRNAAAQFTLSNAAHLSPNTEALVAAAIPINVETRAALAKLSDTSVTVLKSAIEAETKLGSAEAAAAMQAPNALAKTLAGKPHFESEMDRFRKAVFGDLDKYLSQ